MRFCDFLLLLQTIKLTFFKYQTAFTLRIRIVFRLLNRGASIPFHHQHLISSILKKVVAQTSFALSPQPYNFSGLKGQTQISRNGLHFYSKRVTLVFSSPNLTFSQAVVAQIFKYDMVNIGHLTLAPEYIEKEAMPVLETNTKFICISPLVLQNTDDSNLNKAFIKPEDPLFTNALKISTHNRMRQNAAFLGKDISHFFSDFQIVADKKYLSKIQQEEKKFARIYTTKEDQLFKELRGYTFPFWLVAPVEVQTFVFLYGLGELTENGFGMLDMANADPTLRVQQFQIEEFLEQI